MGSRHDQAGPATGGEYDQVLADRAEQQLAAVTDAELTADIRTTAVLLGEVAEIWRQSPQWNERHADVCDTAQTVRAAVEQLSGGDVNGAVDAVAPVLRAWWPWPPPPLAGAAAVVVAHLRHAAMHQPSLVRQCRQLVAAPRDPLWSRILPRPQPPRKPTDAEVTAWGLWLDVTTGLLPALEVGQLRPGEIGEELDLAMGVARGGEPVWGQAGRRFREELEAVAALVDVEARVPAAAILRHAAGRFHRVSGRMLYQSGPTGVGVADGYSLRPTAP